MIQNPKLQEGTGAGTGGTILACICAQDQYNDFVVSLIPRLVLNQQMTNEDGKIGYKYWFTIQEETEEE